MNIVYSKPTEAAAATIRCRLPVRYLDEEETRAMMEAWPGWGGGPRVEVVLDLDARTVRDWPEGKMARLHLKVVDEGVYDLLDEDGEVLMSLAGAYVPSCVPGKYGDYVVMSVGPDGVVEGWRPDADQVVSGFWPDEGGW